MKIAGVLFVAFVASVSLGSSEHQTAPMSARAKAAKMRLQIRAGGGKVEKPYTKRGTIAIVNAQKSANHDWLVSAASYLSNETRFDICAKEGTFSLPSPKMAGDFSIFVIDDESLPQTLIAPESRWGIVNVANLKTDKIQFYEARVKKQISRVFSMLCGGMASSYSLSVASPVGKAEDLDAMPSAQIPFDILNRLPQYLSKFGVSPAVVKTYKIACQEGWAAQPTNEIQRAVWNEFHSIPDKPITIEFDPKKDK